MMKMMMLMMLMSIMIFIMMIKLACAVFPRFGFAYLISEGQRKPPSWERSWSSLNLGCMIWSWNDHDNFDHDHDYHDKEAPEQNLWFLVQVLGLPCGCWWLHSSGRRCRLTLGLEIVMTMMMIMMRRMMIMMRRVMVTNKLIRRYDFSKRRRRRRIMMTKKH